MSAFLRAMARRAAPVLRGRNVMQTANINSKPPEEKIGPIETTIALIAFSFTILGPSGWILAHLDDYRDRE